MILTTVLAAVLIPVLGAYFLQDYLIYYPSRCDLNTLKSFVEGEPISLWPSADKRYRGLLGSSQVGAVKATVLVFHGNAGAAVDRLYYIKALNPLGYRVVINEYPGYGARSGSKSEKSFVYDGVETLAQIKAQWGDPVYLIGESLGCAVATGVAAKAGDDVKGLILITPWKNLPELAQAIYWFLPAKWLVRDSFDNVKNLADFGGPVAVAMADRDEIIPNEQTMTLYRSIPAPKRLWTFRNTGHNSWPVSPREPWWRETTDFLTSHNHPLN